MLSDEEKKALERIEDFLTTNIIVSISNDETADSEELKAFISKNEYLAIEFIASMFLKQSKEIEELKNGQIDFWISDKEIEERIRNKFVSKGEIKAKIEELEKDNKNTFIRGEKILVLQSLLEKE